MKKGSLLNVSELKQGMIISQNDRLLDRQIRE